MASPPIVATRYFYSRPCGRGDMSAGDLDAIQKLFLLTPLWEGRRKHTVGVQCFQKRLRVKIAVLRTIKVCTVVIHCRGRVVCIHQTGKQQSGIQHGFQFIGRRYRKLWQSEIRKILLKRGVCLFQLRCVFNRGRFSGVSVGLLTIICNRVQLRLYHIVGHKTGMVSIDRLYHRTAAGSPL